MKNRILGILLLLIVQFSFAQDERFFYNNQFKISPLKLFDPVNPGYEFSIETFFSKNNAIEVSFAHLSDVFGISDFEKIRGLRAGLTYKRAFSQSKKLDVYYAAEIMACSTRFWYTTRFGVESPWENPYAYLVNYEDRIMIIKSTEAFNINVGMHVYLNHFVFDLSAGVGLKHKNTRHFKRENSFDKMGKPKVPNAYYLAAKEGNYFALNLPLSFKIGYWF